MMKTKNFFLTAAVVLATVLTGTMMTSCSKIDIPVADNDGNPPVPKGKTVKLDTLSAEYVAVNGDTLTGTLAGSYRISIADGATVTLSGVITQPIENAGIPIAGITCLGNATIVLEDDSKNEINGQDENFPGIQAGPEGTTLTICSGINGTGELTATGGDYAAGIGTGRDGSCGDITIEGGKITATGGNNAAGIGSGRDGSCGDITIEGGKITATGGDFGAGIGSGELGLCGDITIKGGEITATGGDLAAGIGTGWKGSCGKITISKPASGTAMGGVGSPYDIGAGVGGDCGEVSVEAETIKGSWDDGSPEDAPIGGGTGDSPIGGEGTIIVHAGAK
jgi:hypothetical protein